MIRLRALSLLFLLGFLFCSSVLLAQQAVDPGNRYERLICIVPMIGSGTYDDPRRPAYAPTSSQPDPTQPGQGILAYSFAASDDGQLALVEFVAMDRAAFATILADARGQLASGESPIPTLQRSQFKVFQKGQIARTVIESAFQKFKPNFNLDSLEVDLP